MTRPAASLPHRAYGDRGAVAAAHPLAVGAGLTVLAEGGGAADAAIAAQAVLGVVMPQACGIGGDALFLVADQDGQVTAVNGTGRAAAAGMDPSTSDSMGSAVTVPGQVAAWGALHERWGILPFDRLLAPAVRLARAGVVMEVPLRQALDAHSGRLHAGGAAGWSLLEAPQGSRPKQAALAGLLSEIGAQGPPAFYEGSRAAQLCEAVAHGGGHLTEADLRSHETPIGPALAVAWDGGRASVQPPVTQGVLLAMALSWLERHDIAPEDLEHVGIELTEAAFAHRDEVAAAGADLLDRPLEVDRDRAAGLGGPRAYLHTAGVSVADHRGVVISSLASVFDDFGSGCFVPSGGFALNNRAEGFTGGTNRFTPGGRPVHTLAPALLQHGDATVGLATPGADGQVQTLLQVLSRLRWTGCSLEEAIDGPRWRSEDGQLLVEASLPGIDDLRGRGHDVRTLEDGDDRFGSVVSAGLTAGVPFAVADWRRQASTGAI